MRLLAKFVENNYEKVDRLLDLRAGAVGRLAAVDREIEQERKQMREDGEEIGPVDEDRWYLRRLEGGLYTLQTVDYILAWICMEDDGVCYLFASSTASNLERTSYRPSRFVDMRNRC